MAECTNDDFKQLNQFVLANKDLKPNLCKDIEQAQVLYSNAKFYYQAAELQGALVSYSCAAILLDSISRNLEPGKVVEEVQQGVPAIVSDEQEEQKEEVANDGAIVNDRSVGKEDTPLSECQKILNCSLNAVEDLQKKVKSMGGSSGKKDDEEEKDWDKICIKNQPLSFEKGSSDCIFFKDVIGLENEKKLVESSLVYPLVYPNLYPKASKGILIYGPPGTGKTYIVKAAVNQLQVKEPGVGVLFFAPSPGDLKGKYVGETEKKIEEVFTCASRAACRYETKSCESFKKKYISIVFMDEFDAIGPNRDRDTTGLAANSVNTLLQMMDGIKSFPNVAVVAATNYPWNLDDAILRRFDTQILIDLPTETDILALLKDEMKRIVTLKADKTEYSWCEQKNKKEMEKTDSKQQKDNCTLACEQKVVEDLYSMAPYNKLVIDFNEEMKTKNGLIAGIANMLASKGFSNSDVNRLMKSAATNAGQLAVKSNLFYSTRLLDDFVSDKYISCLTRFKNEDMAIQKSIDILYGFLKSDSVPDIYEAEKPNFITIDCGGYTYYNIKSILYKSNDYILDDPAIKDIYVKGHEIIMDSASGKPKTKNEITKEEFDAAFSINNYKQNILGYELDGWWKALSNYLTTWERSQPDQDKIAKKTSINPFSNSAEVQNLIADFEKEYTSTNPTTGKTVNPFILKKNGKYKIGKTDIIMAFDFNFNKTDINLSENLTLVPVSKILINTIFTYSYNLYRDVQKQVNQLNLNKDGMGNAWIKKTYEVTDPDVVDITNKDFQIFTISPDNDSGNKPLLDTLIDKSDRKGLSKTVEKLFTDLKFHNLDFYNFLILINKLNEIPEPVAEEAVVADPKKLYGNYYNNLLPNIKSGISVGQHDFNGDDLVTKLANKEFLLKTLNISNTNKQELLLYNVTEEKYYITLAEFSSLIKNIEMYTEIPYFKSIYDKYFTLNDKTYTVKDEFKNYYILIPRDSFTIIFKDTFDLGPDFSSPKIEKDTIGDDLICRITQLYLNDVLSCHKFLKDVYKKSIPIRFKEYFSELDKEFTLSTICNMVCKRIYDNYQFVKDPNTGYNYILGNKAPQGPPAPQGQPRRGGNKTLINKNNNVTNNKSLKHKQILRKSTKSTSARNQKKLNLHGGVQTEQVAETKIDDASDYGKFIKFCLNSEAKPENNYIVNKSAFISTNFDLYEIKRQKRTGGLIDVGRGLYNTGSSISSFFKSFFATKESGETAQQAEDKEKHEIFDELKKKNQLLALIFKKINYIGFIIDPTTEIKDVSEFINQNTESDDKIIKKDANKFSLEISWVPIDTQESFQILRTFIAAIKENPDSFGGAFFTILKNTIVSVVELGGLAAIVTSGVAATGSVIASGASAVGISTASVVATFASFTGVTLTSAMVGTGAAVIVGALSAVMLAKSIYDIVKQGDVTVDDILNTVLLQQMYNTITQLRFINVRKLDMNPSILFLATIENTVNKLNNSWSTYLSETKKSVARIATASSIFNWDSEGLVKRYQLVLGEKVTGSEGQVQYDLGALTELNTKIQTAYNNVLEEREKATNQEEIEKAQKKLEQLEVSKEKARKSLIDAQSAQAAAQNKFILKLNLSGIIIKYKSNEINIPGIKSKLTNLNVPLQSFYYALTVVKSTYNQETGKMLKEYYDDKAKFMEKYKAKLEKK